jgi:hypothetical protein
MRQSDSRHVGAASGPATRNVAEPDVIEILRETAVRAGWREARGDFATGAVGDCFESPLSVDSRVSVVAIRGGSRMTLAEVHPAATFPLHLGRRACYEQVERFFGPGVVVICDASATRMFALWRGVSRPFTGLCREVAVSVAATDTLNEALRDVSGRPPSVVSGSDILDAMRHRRLLPRSLADERGVRSPCDAARSIGCAETGRDALRVWAALRRVYFLDPDCGGGEWLEAGIRALEPLYAASLQRMLGCLTESGNGRRGTGTERMRRLIHAAGGDTLRSAERFIRWNIVLHNLHGLSASRFDVSATRLRLARAVQGSEGAGAFAAIAARVVRLESGSEDAPSLLHASVNDREMVGRLQKAYEIIRDLQLTGRTDPVHLRRAYRELRSRRRRHNANVSGHLPGGDRDARVHFPNLFAPGALVIRPTT